MNDSSRSGERSRLIGSAAARLASQRWACPECADGYGCRSGRYGCEACSPPRTPRPQGDPDEW